MNLVVAYSNITGCLLTGGQGTKNSNYKSALFFSLSNWATNLSLQSVSHHGNLDSTAGVPMLTGVKQSGLKCQIFTPSRRNDWERERKHVLKKIDAKAQGSSSIGAVVQMTAAA